LPLPERMLNSASSSTNARLPCAIAFHSSNISAADQPTSRSRRTNRRLPGTVHARCRLCRCRCGRARGRHRRL
jgi:hypothetical protein